VENSLHTFLWPASDDSDDSDDSDIPRKVHQFLFHYIHDLESVTWCFVHHVFLNVPVLPALCDIELFEQLNCLRTLQSEYKEFFPDRKVELNSQRAMYIRQKDNLYAWITKQCKTHGSVTALLAPLRSNKIIRKANMDLSKKPQELRNPYRWHEARFTSQPCQLHCALR
jgi:hypothetical protein